MRCLSTYRYSSFISKRINFFLCILVFCISGCKKFLEITPSRIELPTSSVFNDPSTANSAITGIYSQMINDRGFPYYISLYTGLSADELTDYSALTEIGMFYTNSLNPDAEIVGGELWTPAYSYIYQANAAIEGLSASAGLSEELKQQLLGEAKFIRAFWYFYLVNIFGDVPIVTTTDYNASSLARRDRSDSVYAKIISDLQEARSLLISNFVGADGISISEERIRVNKWVATAMLARVYLYAGDFEKSENEASKVINHTGEFEILSDLNEVFKSNSRETIWALQPNVAFGVNTPEGQNYILQGPPESFSAVRSTSISPGLLNSFEGNDLRKDAWLGVFDNYYYPYKYRVAFSNEFEEYSVVLRLAEQYLIRAEARAQQGKISESQADLNIIRSRAGLPNTIASGKADLLLKIEQERRVELFSEYGHRWFDLKRTGRINVIMPVESPKKGGSWSSYKSLFPIPQKERDNNPNLSQNEGY